MSEHGRERFVTNDTSVDERAFFEPVVKGVEAKKKWLEDMLERHEIPAAYADEWLCDFYEQRTRLKAFIAWQQTAQILLGQLHTGELLDCHKEWPYGRFLYNDAKDSDKMRCFTVRLSDDTGSLMATLDHFQLQRQYVVDEAAFRQSIFDAYYKHGVNLLVTPADIIPPETLTSTGGFWIGEEHFAELQHTLKLQRPSQVLEPEANQSVLEALARAEYEAQRAEAAASSLARSIFVYDATHITTNDPLESLFSS